MILIGIDPGVQTGFAEWDTGLQRLLFVSAGTILECMQLVEVRACSTPAGQLFVTFEDARKRKWFGNRADMKTERYGAGVREGVGSVKRDCAIWEEFLGRLGVPFEARYPHSTKMKAEMFERTTGWRGRTNEHARDAAMIVFGINESIARAKLIAFNDGPHHDGNRVRPDPHSGRDVRRVSRCGSHRTD